jgi:phenylalanyl-tRNA synthetase beta chain
VQRRLRLAGMRPINSVVDATNYVMLELGQPLHAFNYDVLTNRAGGKAPTIITRAANEGEKLTTLDDIERILEPYTIMVCDTAGPLSLAGVMGGLESEVHPHTTRVLLEGASWNFINVRRTAFSQHLISEAAYRFSRGVHPSLASEGVILCLQRMAEWSGGQVYSGLVDNYPAPPHDPEIELTGADVRRILGVDLNLDQIAAILSRLEFTCRVNGDRVLAKTPPHRLDIGTGATGKADLLEEIARIHGYDNIPLSYLPDDLPEARSDRALEIETQVRHILVRLGLQEVVNYRLTSPEREARLYPAGVEIPSLDYLGVKNPLSPERSVMRRSLLASILETLEKNARLRERQALFEIGPVFLPKAGQILPDEPLRLSIAITGLRLPPAWDTKENPNLDYYDLKGILEALLEEMHIGEISFSPGEHAAFHPGKCAEVRAGETPLGVIGELHPLVKEKYDFLSPPVLVADFDLQALIACAVSRHEVTPVPTYPPVMEDIAVIVDESTPAVEVEAAIRQGGGQRLKALRLFDIYRGGQIGVDKKSLAYSLTYQAEDHTLNSEEASQIRQKIIRHLEQTLGARLRS